MHADEACSQLVRNSARLTPTCWNVNLARRGRRRIFVGGSVFEPTLAVEDHAGILPVSLRLRTKLASFVLLNLFVQPLRDEARRSKPN